MKPDQGIENEKPRFALCMTILVVTILEKFWQGGWLTLVITGGLVCLCFVVRGHYRRISAALRRVYAKLEDLRFQDAPDPARPMPPKPTAAVLPAGTAVWDPHRHEHPAHVAGTYKNLVFMSVGVIDSGSFKGEGEIEALRARTEAMLRQYVDLARRLGIAATYRRPSGPTSSMRRRSSAGRCRASFPDDLLHRQGRFRAGNLVPPAPPQRDGVRGPEAPRVGGQPMVILPARVA